MAAWRDGVARWAALAAALMLAGALFLPAGPLAALSGEDPRHLAAAALALLGLAAALGLTILLWAQRPASRTAPAKDAGGEPDARLLALTCDLVFETDAELRLTHVAQSHTIILRDLEELIGADIRSGIDAHPENAEEAAAARAALAASGSFRGIVYPLRRITGDVVFLSLNAEMRRTGEGGFAGYRGTATDVTPLVRARRALAEAEDAARTAAARFQAFADLGSDWMWETGADLRLTFVSEGIRAVGASPDEILGLDLRDILSGDPAAGTHAQRLAQALSARVPFRGLVLQFVGAEASGPPLWLEAGGTPVLDAAGAFAGYRGVMRDVTARIEEGAQSGKAIARYEALVSNVDAVLFRLANDPQRTITYVSPNVGRIVGLPADAFIGRTIDDLIPSVHRDDLAAYLAETEAAAAANRPIERQYRMRRPDGRFVWFHERTNPVDFDANGRPRAFDGCIFDVTEQVEIKARLAEARELFESLIAGVDGVLFRISMEAEPRILFISPTTERMAGVPPQALLGQPISVYRALVHPDDWSRYWQESQAALAAKTGRQIEYRIRLPDGRTRWVFERTRPVPVPVGEPCVADGFIVDVTALHEARQARDAAFADLAGRERMFADITANMDGVLFRVGLEPEMPYRFVTQGIERFVGKPARELIGKPVILNPMRIHPEDKERYFAAYAEALARNVPLSIEYRELDLHGDLRWLHETAQGSDFGPDGQPRAVDGFFVDITPIKSLSAQNDLFAEAVRSVDAGVAIADVSKPGQPLVFVNEAFTRITGYEASEALGRNCRFLQGPQTDPAAVARIKQALDEGRAVELEILNYRRDGSPFWNELSLGPVTDPATGAAFFIAVQRDVTARHQASEELAKARDAAEEGSRAKSQFLAMMSHEIRTPMNGVLGMTEALLETPLEDTQRRALETIRGSADTLMRLIDDVLDLSKLEAGRIDLAVEAFDLSALVASVVTLLAPRAEAKGLGFHDTIDPAIPAAVMGDPLRIRQVLLNLLGNAIKFTEAGGISLKLERLVQDRVRVTVADTGIGIPARRRDALFQDYMQVDASVARRFGGTGLGLAISKRLVERMGGSIGVESTEGAGATFWFEIPLPAAERPPEAAHEETPRRDVKRSARRMLAGLRLLVVEDNATNRDVIARLLGSEGWSLAFVETGEEAAAAAEAGGLDVILMDLNLPGIGGLEAARRIRALEGAAGAVPIIALTANAFPEDAAASRAAGMQAHVAKPFRKRDLIAAIEAVLAAAKPARPGRGASVRRRKDAPAGGKAPALDWRMIEAFRADAGEEALLAILETFVRDAAGKLVDLAQMPGAAAAAGEALRLVHSLKSAAANVGAAALSERAAALEADLAMRARKPARRAIAALESRLKAWAKSLRDKGIDLDA